MPAFTRTDLQYKDYTWTTTEGDSAKVKGFPDNVLLNRKEGYEVVHFIDRFMGNQKSWENETTQEKRSHGHKLERMIHDKLPGEIRSHKKVSEWIAANWATSK